MTALTALLDATWPAAVFHEVGPWVLREGRGGGSRVSAATPVADWTPDDIALIEARAPALGQDPLFMITSQDQPLDRELSARGYELLDPVYLWSAATRDLAAALPPLATFSIWPPLAIQRDIWSDGHIGPARLAVMERVTGPKTALLSRSGDRASGVAFVASHVENAMLHALHVLPQARRQGSAANMLRAAANWAQDHGATTLFLAVTQANAAANALYASLNMQIVGNYHYRRKIARERQ